MLKKKGEGREGGEGGRKKYRAKQRRTLLLSQTEETAAADGIRSSQSYLASKVQPIFWCCQRCDVVDARAGRDVRVRPPGIFFTAPPLCNVAI